MNSLFAKNKYRSKFVNIYHGSFVRVPTVSEPILSRNLPTAILTYKRTFHLLAFGNTEIDLIDQALERNVKTTQGIWT